ncbi:MAG TPA: serine hydrolase [Thermomicrobiales bacterium]|nr:serine hydrolase [Thermomicrobiales bacterium]
MNLSSTNRCLTRRSVLRAGLASTAMLAAGPAVSARQAPAATPTGPHPVAAQVEWLLAQINAGGDGLTDEAIAGHLAPSFLTAAPSGKLVSLPTVVAQFRELADALGELTLNQFAGDPAPSQTIAVVTAADGAYYLIVSTEEQAPHRIIDAFVLPVVATELPAVPTSWHELDAGLAAQADEVNFLAAEIVDGDMLLIHALDADAPLGVGSTFKLYVLGELARQIGRDEAAWEEELAIRTDWKGIASQGADVMAYEPDGTRHTLREYATRMMAISSNTATDHLIMRLGRQRVEAAMRDMGHADPVAGLPLLTTREVYALQRVLPVDRMEAYIAAGEMERRALLAGEIEGVDVAPVHQLAWLRMRSLDPAVQWTASAADAARAMAALLDMARRPGLEPILDILAQNPGIDPEALGDAFTYVGFKGGTFPGVSNRTWLLRRADDRWFVVSAGLTDPAGRVDIQAPVPVIAGAFPLLAAV